VNIRVGTDVVQIERIKRSIEKESFVKKVFTPVEIEYATKKADAAASFAARFAAKEAFFKALGTGLYTQGMGPQDVWIENSDNGRPFLKFSAAAESLLQQQGLCCCTDVSLAHDGPVALATVVLLFKTL
jgi:holo-[acyl-carrier protein] synthase